MEWYVLSFPNPKETLEEAIGAMVAERADQECEPERVIAMALPLTKAQYDDLADCIGPLLVRVGDAQLPYIYSELNTLEALSEMYDYIEGVTHE